MTLDFCIRPIVINTTYKRSAIEKKGKRKKKKMVGETPDIIIRGNKVMKKPGATIKTPPKPKRTPKVNVLGEFKKLYNVSRMATNIIVNATEYCLTLEDDLASGYEPYFRVFELKNGKKIKLTRKSEYGIWKTKIERYYMVDENDKVDFFNFPTYNVSKGKMVKGKYSRPSRSGLRMVFQKVNGKYIPIMSDNYDAYANFFDSLRVLDGNLKNKQQAKFLKDVLAANLPAIYRANYGINPEKVAMERRSASEIKNTPYMPRKAYKSM